MIKKLTLGKIVGVDIVDMEEISGVKFIKKDIHEVKDLQNFEKIY